MVVPPYSANYAEAESGVQGQELKNIQGNIAQSNLKNLYLYPWLVPTSSELGLEANILGTAGKFFYVWIFFE